MDHRHTRMVAFLLLIVGSCIGGHEATPGTADRGDVKQTRSALGTPAQVLRVSDFGASGDGVADDSAAIQAALNASATIGGPNVVWFDPKPYRTTATLLIKQHMTHIEGHHAVINYAGPGFALDVTPIGGTVYPVNVSLNELSFILSTAGAKGVHWRFSYSFARATDVVLKAPDQVGFELLGDVNGTGPYYNTLIDCSVQGNAPAASN